MQHILQQYASRQHQVEQLTTNGLDTTTAAIQVQEIERLFQQLQTFNKLNLQWKFNQTDENFNIMRKGIRDVYAAYMKASLPELSSPQWKAFLGIDAKFDIKISNAKAPAAKQAQPKPAIAAVNAPLNTSDSSALTETKPKPSNAKQDESAGTVVTDTNKPDASSTSSRAVIKDPETPAIITKASSTQASTLTTISDSTAKGLAAPTPPEPPLIPLAVNTDTPGMKKEDKSVAILSSEPSLATTTTIIKSPSKQAGVQCASCNAIIETKPYASCEKSRSGTRLLSASKVGKEALTAVDAAIHLHEANSLLKTRDISSFPELTAVDHVVSGSMVIYVKPRPTDPDPSDAYQWQGERYKTTTLDGCCINVAACVGMPEGQQEPTIVRRRFWMCEEAYSSTPGPTVVLMLYYAI